MPKKVLRRPVRRGRDHQGRSAARLLFSKGPQHADISSAYKIWVAKAVGYPDGSRAQVPLQSAGSRRSPAGPSQEDVIRQTGGDKQQIQLELVGVWQ